MEIRKIRQEDFDQILSMMEVFYASDALLIHPDTQTLAKTLTDCIADGPYLEGFVMENEDRLAGYGMVAKSFSTEFGKPCIWIEDLYVESPYRNMGLGSAFLKFVENKYPGHLLRLEVEKENERAVHVYEKCGFEEIPYMEMKK